MWYIKLLEYCAKKINKSERDEAVLFIHNLFDLLKNKLLTGEELEPMLILGFIVDLYKFVNLKRKNPLSLTEFAEQSIGLLVLHLKYSADEGYFCSEFVELIADAKISGVFKIEGELSAYRRQYLLGQRRSEYVVPLSGIHTLRKYMINNDALMLLTHTDVIKRIEAKVFYDLNYWVKASLDEMVMALNVLLNKTDDQFNVLFDLHKYLLPYRNKDLKFDQFIAAVDRELRKFNLLRGSSGHHNYLGTLTKFLHYNYNNYTVINDDEEKDPDYKSLFSKKIKKRVYVELIVIPQLSFEQLAQYNPEIISICEQLDKYTLKNPGISSFFGKKPVREHMKEIAIIVDDIKKGKFLSIQTIFDELNTIKIINSADELVQILDFIEQKNMDEISINPGCTEQNSFNFLN